MGSASGIQRPDQGRIQGDAYGRIAAQAKRPIGDDTVKDELDVVFPYPGSVGLFTWPRFYPRWAVRITGVIASLRTAGTSNTVVTLSVSGTSIGTITLGSGATFASVTLYKAMTANLDYLTVAITTAGTGAADLNIQVRFN